MTDSEAAALLLACCFNEVEDQPDTMQMWPCDGNELTLRLSDWWSLNTWLLVADDQPMKDRES